MRPDAYIEHDEEMSAEAEFTQDLVELLTEQKENVGNKVVSVRDYKEVGMLTNDNGFVVRLEDGREYQVTVKRSK